MSAVGTSISRGLLSASSPLVSAACRAAGGQIFCCHSTLYFRCIVRLYHYIDTIMSQASHVLGIQGCQVLMKKCDVFSEARIVTFTFGIAF